MNESASETVGLRGGLVRVTGLEPAAWWSQTNLQTLFCWERALFSRFRYENDTFLTS